MEGEVSCEVVIVGETGTYYSDARALRGSRPRSLAGATGWGYWLGALAGVTGWGYWLGMLAGGTGLGCRLAALDRGRGLPRWSALEAEGISGGALPCFEIGKNTNGERTLLVRR